MGQGPGLSVVIPTLNEARTIEPLLTRLSEALAGVAHEVIVVDDGSTDGTRHAAARAGVNARVIHRAREQGLATAVVRGFEEATGEFVAVLDGDLQHPPEVVREMFRAAQWSGADLVVGSRYVEGGSDGGFGPLRRLVSWAARRGAWAALPELRQHGVSDPTSGLFLVRRDKLALEALQPEGYKILLEVIHRCPVGAVAEVGFRFEPRRDGESKLGPRTVVAYLKHLGRLAWDDRENRRLAQFVGVGAIGILVNLAVLYALATGAGLHYLASAALSIEASIVTNFALNDRFTFGDLRHGNTLARFVRFNVVSLFALVVNLAVLALLTELAGLHYLLAEVVAIGVAFLTNYRGNLAWTYEASQPTLDTRDPLLRLGRRVARPADRDKESG